MYPPCLLSNKQRTKSNIWNKFQKYFHELPGIPSLILRVAITTSCWRIRQKIQRNQHGCVDEDFDEKDMAVEMMMDENLKPPSIPAMMTVFVIMKMLMTSSPPTTPAEARA